MLLEYHFQFHVRFKTLTCHPLFLAEKSIVKLG